MGWKKHRLVKQTGHLSFKVIIKTIFCTFSQCLKGCLVVQGDKKYSVSGRVPGICGLFESLFKTNVTCGIKGGSNQIVDSQVLLATWFLFTILNVHKEITQKKTELVFQIDPRIALLFLKGKACYIFSSWPKTCYITIHACTMHLWYRWYISYIYYIQHDIFFIYVYIST